MTKPLVFKAGLYWFVTNNTLDAPHFPTWREAFDHAFVVASVSGAARIRQAVEELP